MNLIKSKSGIWSLPDYIVDHKKALLSISFVRVMMLMDREAFIAENVDIQQDALSSLQAMLPDAEVERIAEKCIDDVLNENTIDEVAVIKQAIHSALALVRKNEDTEMLDWLEQHVAYINCECDDEHETMWTLPTRGKGHDNGELRLAIREAMKK